MAVKIRMLSDALGVEILGVDPAQPMSPDLVKEIRQLWLQHNITLFRGVDWTPAQQIAFTQQFGERHMLRTTLEGDTPYFETVSGERVQSSLA